jgi:hypothetical protein
MRQITAIQQIVAVITIVARFGIDAAFRNPGSIDPDRGSGT